MRFYRKVGRKKDNQAAKVTTKRSPVINALRLQPKRKDRSLQLGPEGWRRCALVANEGGSDPKTEALRGNAPPFPFWGQSSPGCSHADLRCFVGNGRPTYGLSGTLKSFII